MFDVFAKENSCWSKLSLSKLQVQITRKTIMSSRKLEFSCPQKIPDSRTQARLGHIQRMFLFFMRVTCRSRVGITENRFTQLISSLLESRVEFHVFPAFSLPITGTETAVCRYFPAVRYEREDNCSRRQAESNLFAASSSLNMKQDAASDNGGVDVSSEDNFC